MSCVEQDITSPPIFHKEIEAEVNIINSDETIIPYPKAICVDSSYIYVLSLMDNQWIHIYDKKNGEYINSCIKRGKGPGEVTLASNMQIDKKTGLISLFDGGRMKHLTFKKDTQKDVPDFQLEGEKELIKHAKIIRRSWHLKNNCYLVDGQLEETDSPQRFQLLCQDSIISTYNPLPANSETSLSVYLGAHVTISPDAKKMAAGTLYGGGLEVFDLQEGIQNVSTQTFYTPKYPSPENSSKGMFETPFCFTDITSTNEYIYGIWNGCLDPNSNSNIIVFDWKGNGIVKCITNKLIVKSCVFGNNIYAIAFDEEKGFYFVTLDTSQWGL